MVNSNREMVERIAAASGIDLKKERADFDRIVKKSSNNDDAFAIWLARAMVAQAEIMALKR